jgi:hypothetical protein
MPQSLLQKIDGAWYSFSFTSGYTKAVQCKKLSTEREVLAYALWLSNQGRERESDAVIEWYCNKRHVFDTTPP